MTLLPLVLRRITRHWLMLLTVSLGVLLATALLASAPLLVDAVVNFGLNRTLTSPDPLTRNARMTLHLSPDPGSAITARAVAAMDIAVRDEIERYVGNLLAHDTGTPAGIVQSLETYWLHPWLDDGLVTNQRVNARYYENIADHIVFVDGAWPSSPMLAPDKLAVVIGEEMAGAYDLRVGDELPLSFKKDANVPDVWMRIVGVVRPKEVDSVYWFGTYGPLRADADSRWMAQYNALVSKDVLFEVAGTWFPRAGIDQSWHALLDPELIVATDSHALREQFADLRVTLREMPTRILLQTSLPDVLETFEQRATVVRAPLYLLTAEIVLLALYYVVMVAALAVRQVEREFATLGSRGASRRQIFTMQLIEAGLLSLVALLSGPGLGAFLVRGLTWLGPLSDVPVGEWRLARTWGVWLAAGAGALASLLGLMLPVGPLLKRSVVVQQRDATRTARVPWWQRLYLDVFVLVAGMIFLWRFQLYGGIVGGVTTRPETDWLLLLSPLMLLLGSATILLRVFPLILRVIAAVTVRGRGLVGSLAMWPSARNPSHVARLVLLLTLAMALGILSTGLNATLDASELERAAYVTGGDARLAVNRFVSPAALEMESGVVTATGLWRGMGTVDLRNYPRFEVLAVDADALQSLATYREDFADQPVEDLLAHLVGDPGVAEISTAEAVNINASPLVLPGQPSSIGVWVWAPLDESAGLPIRSRVTILGESNHERAAIRVKLRSSEGEFITLHLYPGRAAGCTFACPRGAPCDRFPVYQLTPDYRCAWHYFSAPLPALANAAYPLTVESFWFQNRARMRYGNSRVTQGMSNFMLQLALDDVTVVDGLSGESIVVEDFENPTAIWTLDAGSTTYRLTGGLSGPARQNVWPFFSRVGQNVGLRLYSTSALQPIPALVSEAFVAETQVQTGNTFRAWVASLPPVTFRVEGVVRYFPTLYEDDPRAEGIFNAGYVVTVRDLVLPRLNQLTSQATNANEVWLDVDSESAEALSHTVPGVTQAWTVDEERQTIKANPMTLGLRSVTFFGSAITSALSLVGFGTYFYMSARQRAATYGVLRSMGLSPLQLYASLVLEQVVLILWGLGFGTGLGIVLNQLVLPGLPISLGDRPPVPPFIPQDDWSAVGRLYGTLAGAFLLVLAVATVFLWRAKLHQALRIGQE